MKLTWYGHASFRVAAKGGASVVTDPYDPATSGYKSVLEPADIVVISSATDSFHCNAHLVPGSPVVVNSLELARSGKSRTVRDVTFHGAEASEAPDHRGGQTRGQRHGPLYARTASASATWATWARP